MDGILNQVNELESKALGNVTNIDLSIDQTIQTVMKAEIKVEKTSSAIALKVEDSNGSFKLAGDGESKKMLRVTPKKKKSQMKG